MTPLSTEFKMHGSAFVVRAKSSLFLALGFIGILSSPSHSLGQPLTTRTSGLALPSITPGHSCTPYPHLQTNRKLGLDQAMVTTGDISLVYIRVRFPDEDAEPVLLEDAKRDLTQATALLESLSYGRCHLHWSITPVFTLPKSRDDYAVGDAFNGLLEDARALAKAHGFDYLQYELDVVRHTGIAGLASGSANVGSRGLQLAASGWFILLHELGHNFGLYHANFWDTKGSDLPQGAPPLPSDYKELGDPFSIPVHPNSSLGQPSLTGPGQSLEYGDPWDFMGSGGDHFSIPNRMEMGWVDEQNIVRVSGSGIHRLYAPEVSRLSSGKHYALQIPTCDHALWLELAPTNASYPNAGIILRWTQPDRTIGTELLQPTVAFANDSFERTLRLGTTFSDRFRDVHVTPIQSGGSEFERWIDVAIELSAAVSNRPPKLEPIASRRTAAVGEPVVLTATAVDPDGDVLSWRWDFDDASTSLTPGQVEKAWSAAGDYVVQLEVSDRRGGVGRSHVVVTIGEPITARVTGRVTDEVGNPILSARVHSLAVEGKNRTLRWMLTDSDGRYTLTQLPPGIYTNGAFAFGFHMGAVEPMEVTARDVFFRDFRLRTLPRIVVSKPRFLSEGAGRSEVFTLTRTGPADQPLVVPYRLAGSAIAGHDYEKPDVQSVVIPSGKRSASIELTILDAPGVEPPRTVELILEIPNQSEQRRIDGKPYTRYYPGLDLELIDGQPFWTQTDPSFVPGPSATVTLVDDDLRLDVFTEEPDTITLRLKADPGMSVHLESSLDLKDWSFFSTQVLPRTGVTELKIPSPKVPRLFFRLAVSDPPTTK